MFKGIQVLRLTLSALLLFTASIGTALAADDKAAGAEKLPTCTSCTKCGDAVGGEVPTVDGFCDIYSRQIEYMQASKKFRASLVARQESYEKPRREALEIYRQNLEAIYKEESKAYQQQLADEAAKAAEMKKAAEAVDEADGDKTEAKTDTATEDTEKTAATETAEDTEAQEAEPGVKEKVIEPTAEEEGPVKKRVIMPEDAPEFDESPF